MNDSVSETTNHQRPVAEERKTKIQRFVEYAFAFEQVLASDDWSALERFFAADAIRQVVGGGPLATLSIGRDSVIGDLRRGVAELDRRFDRRLPEIISGPSEHNGAVWIDWRLTLQRDGLPDLVVEGTHGTAYDGDRICRIDEAVTNAHTERVEAYLAAHGNELLPGPGPSALPRRALPLSNTHMRSVAGGYARAKSRADIEAALSFCHPRFTLETVPFGISSRDREETALHLAAFFAAFPDYEVTLTDMTFGDASLGCWGTARMTMRGEGFGLAPTGRRVEIPVFCALTFADGLLASERFFFDLAAFCDGIGVPLALLRDALDGLRNDRVGVIAGG